jgi:D-sedoheptulose 7-phosphate isomerase
MNSIKQHFSEAADILSQFLANDKNFEAIEAAGKLMVTALQNEKKIISCGNGGSLCDAMHFAEELTGRYRDDRKPFAAISMYLVGTWKQLDIRVMYCLLFLPAAIVKTF